MNVDEIWKYNDLCLTIDPRTHHGYPKVSDIEQILRLASAPLAQDNRSLSRQTSDQSSGGPMSTDSSYTEAVGLEAAC